MPRRRLQSFWLLNNDYPLGISFIHSGMHFTINFRGNTKFISINILIILVFIQIYLFLQTHSSNGHITRLESALPT